MSHEYDAESAAYEAKLRAMVLVDVALDDKGDEVFAVMYDGKPREYFADSIIACDHAEKWARQLGCKWDVTIQARNAADMS